MRNQSGKGKVEREKATRSLRARAIRLSPFPFRLSPVPSPRPLSPPRGITLIEVLISMFVLLFGLMGVAAIFPVASHYILEGDKRDRSSGLAQMAFEELKARKYLRPTDWVFQTQTRTNPNPDVATLVISPFVPKSFLGSYTHIGNAFVLDPLGGISPETNTTKAQRQFFPRSTITVPGCPWSLNNRVDESDFIVNQWPVKRVTIDSNPDPFQSMALKGNAAETAFRLRDDLAVVQPDAGDRPSIQRWRTDGSQLLSRDYVGDYSWLATIVPTSLRALVGMQPGANIKDAFYEVTTVVFYKRDIVPSTTIVGSPGSERLIGGEFMNETELAIYDYDTSNAHPETVESALDGIKPGNWIAVMGVNPNLGPVSPSTNRPCGQFFMKWYKVQAMDDETSSIVLSNGTTVQGRYLMVQGPDWPAARNNAGVNLGWQNLRVAILPGAIDAYTRVMQMDVE